MRLVSNLAISFAGMILPVCAQKVPDTRLDTDIPGSAWSESPQIAASGSAVYAIWQDYRPVGGGVLFNRSLDGGATWLATDVRTGAAHNLGSPQRAHRSMS